MEIFQRKQVKHLRRIKATKKITTDAFALQAQQSQEKDELF